MVSYRDNGKEHGNYHNVGTIGYTLGLYRDKKKW